MRRVLQTLLFLVLLPCFILGQGKFKVSGKVTDAAGEPLIGASVMIRALNSGNATDLDGNFSFEIANDLAKNQRVELTASMVNYKKKSITVLLNGNNIKQDFLLEEDVFQNEEIVVTGIASKTSRSVAEVAVARISAGDLSKVQSYSSLSQLVAGKVAGVQMNTSSGNVGSGWRFTVRGGGGINGDEQPTIYIDGVRADNSELVGYGAGGQGISTLSNLNPNDIDKIEFLKGPAAAAMYGTNGSNGVVLITTKSGKMGVSSPNAFNLEYRFNYGYNEAPYKYKTEDFITAEVANRQFVKGPIREHYLSSTGGYNVLKYYASFEKRLEDGILPSTTGDRTAVRVNLTALPSSKFSLKLSSSYVYNKINRPPNDNIIYGYLNNTLGSAVPFPNVKEGDFTSIKDNSTMNQFIGSFQANYKPIEDFEITAGVGIDYSNWEQIQMFPYDKTITLITNGSKREFFRNNRQYTYDFNASYQYKLFDAIQVKSIVGGQFFEVIVRTANIRVDRFNTGLITDLGAGSEVQGKGEFFQNTRQGGIFTEHSFNYDEQYFLTLAIRKDYANTIGKDAPSITYPKASFALRVDKYDFLPSYVNLLKLRFAYGENGILPTATNSIPFLWSANPSGYGSGARLNNIGNPSIEPERLKEIEVGFDAELFSSLSLELTHYRQKATNSIVGMQLAPSTGLTATAMPFNIGAMDIWGYETQIQYTPFRSADYTLDLSFIYNYQNNEVTDLGGAQPIYDAWGDCVIKEGLSKHEFYLYKTIGAKFDPVTQKYTGRLDTETEVDAGSPIPKHTGSFTINFRFLKNFTFYFMAEYALGHKVYNGTKWGAVLGGNGVRYNTLRALLGLSPITPTSAVIVTPLTPGTNEYIDAANEYARSSTAWDGNYLESADYLYFKELSLSYNFDDLLKDFSLMEYVKSLSMGLSVRNLGKITKYSGADVEVNWGGSRSLARGQDYFTLMSPRTINFWVRMGF